ncbi:MAG: immunoglobulin domain-containing protein [Verrucomicrobiota bacterium]
MKLSLWEILVVCRIAALTLVSRTGFAAPSPSITTQPQSQSVVTGTNTTFSVVASGQTPLAYQWSFNGTNLTNSARISGATTNILTVSNIGAGDAGNYRAIVSNSHGTATSSNATLTVLIPAAITGQPANQSVLINSNVIFSATATGTAPLNYRWYFNGTPLNDDANVSGSTTTNLNISNVQTNHGGSYQLVVTNNYGSATSEVAGLTVLIPVAITVQPSNQLILLNSNATFTTDASGTGPLNFRWFFNDAPLAGQTSNLLVLNSVQTNQAGNYYFIVTNSYGAATSSVATLTVLVPATITAQPSNQSVILNSNATFTVAATGTGSIFYQWLQNGTALTNSGKFIGTATSTLTISGVQTNDTASYQVVVTNNYGAVTSSIATLTVLIPANITAQPTNKSVLLNSNATFNVTAIGTETLSYKWLQNGMTITNGGWFSGATTSTLSISGAQTNDSAPYQVIVTNSYGAATSSVITLTVYVPVLIMGQPSSASVLLGSNASFTVSATGTFLGYQWYFSGTPLSDGGRITGSSTPTLNIADVQTSDAGGYVVVVTNLFSAVTSRTASLTPLVGPTTSVRYVNLNSANPLTPYLGWNTAATNIQDAIDAAVNGDQILVTNGTYNTGGRVFYGSSSNRVVVDKAVIVKGVSGSDFTTIAGFQGGPAPYGMRCVYLTNGATLIGFTVMTGGSAGSGDPLKEKSGGGVWCESSTSVVSNCVLRSNYAAQGGGGVYQGTLLNCLFTNNIAGQGGGAYSCTLINCTLANNSSSFQGLNSGGGANSCNLSNCLLVSNRAGTGGGGGGGAYFSTLNNCVLSNNTAIYGGGLCLGVANSSLISSNRASSSGGGSYSNVLNNCVLKNNLAVTDGGGAYGSALVNCTIVGNSASSHSGGLFRGSANNCIIYYNSSTKGDNFNEDFFPVINNSCTTPLPIRGMGNFIYDPTFVNTSSGDFHLQANSPCINAGNNSYITNTTDFDVNPRTVGGTVDVGAYEFQTPSSVLSYAFAQQFGLPTDGSADFSDADSDGLNNWQEWRAGTNPTNAFSVLQMLSPTNSISGVVVKWASVSNITYFLERSTNLASQPPFSLLKSNVLGQSAMTTYTDTNAVGNGPFFYRVGIQP